MPFDHQTTSFGRLRPVFELSSRHTKVQASALQTFADVLNVDHIKKKRA